MGTRWLRRNARAAAHQVEVLVQVIKLCQVLLLHARTRSQQPGVAHLLLKDHLRPRHMRNSASEPLEGPPLKWPRARTAPVSLRLYAPRLVYHNGRGVDLKARQLLDQPLILVQAQELGDAHAHKRRQLRVPELLVDLLHHALRAAAAVRLGGCSHAARGGLAGSRQSAARALSSSSFPSSSP